MISRWRDQEALVAFAGPQWNRPVIPAGMEPYGTACSVEHLRYPLASCRRSRRPWNRLKVIILGNARAGKTTLKRTLMASHPAALLSLDEVAFQGGT